MKYKKKRLVIIDEYNVSLNQSKYYQVYSM